MPDARDGTDKQRVLFQTRRPAFTPSCANYHNSSLTQATDSRPGSWERGESELSDEHA